MAKWPIKRPVSYLDWYYSFSRNYLYSDFKLKHMLNILIITILALVVIAAGVQMCRPKDHGEYEPMFTDPEFNIIDNGPNGKLEVTATMQMDSLTAAMLRHLQDELITNLNYKP